MSKSKTALRPRVLVVEDEQVIRELIVEVLTDAGFDVVPMDTADDAIPILEADGFQLLVTDVHMPGSLDGVDLARRAQHHEPPLPVVFVTARPDVVSRLKAADIKGSVLIKPFKLSDLVHRVLRFVNPGSA